MILLLILFVVKFAPLQAANVLVYNPMYGQSHISLLGNIADILARAGHNVTVFSVEITPNLQPFGTTERGIHKISLGMNIKNFQNADTEVLSTISNLWDSDELIAFKPSDLESFYDTLLESHKILLENGILVDSLRNSQFDLAVHEFYDIGATAIMELFNIKKTILVSAIGDIPPYTYEVTGVPHFESFVPAWLTIFGDQLNMLERFQTLQTLYSVKHIVRDNEQKVLNLFRSYASNFPDPTELLLKKTGMIFANVNEFTQTPRPFSSMIQFIGGSNLYPPKPIEEVIGFLYLYSISLKALSELLNKRKYNVLFSLGSYVRLSEAPLRVKQIIADSFNSMDDVTFLVKYENSSGDSFNFDAYSNIVTRAWFPQKDLLGDNRINIFITHGGMNSITEGQYRGKPMISIPVYADQILNAQSAARAGSTVVVDKRMLSKSLLVRTIRDMLNSKSTHVVKAKFIQKCLEGREEEYRKKIVKWVELQAEAEKPFDHLVLHSRNLSTLELYNLDILAIITLFVILTLGLSFCILRMGISFIKNSTNKSKIE